MIIVSVRTEQVTCRVFFHVPRNFFMVLPLSLLRSASNHPILVELKSGETYSGVLAECDGWMNMHMRDAVLTSKDGDKFWRVPACYIRGNNVKTIRVPDEVIDLAVRESAASVADRAQFVRGKGKGKGMPAGIPAGHSRS
jgi:U6 snRNA-associated Sm-like protein LSm4